VSATEANDRRSARAWRIAIILLGVLVLCSCRSTGTRQPVDAVPGEAEVPASPASSSPSPNQPAPPPAASSVVPTAYVEPLPAPIQPTAPPSAQPYPAVPMDCPCIMGMPGMEGGVPLPYVAAGPWIPPGIVPPWPADEYLRDGGAIPPGVAAGKNGGVIGLQMEDTVARFTTLDGKDHVEPSNKVELYSPRFCAVRQVVDVEVDQQRHRAAGLAEPVKAVGPRTSEPVATNTQDLQPIRGIGTNPAGQLRGRLTYAAHQTELLPHAFDFGFRAFENISLIRTGIYVGNEQPILARGAQAAVAWTRNEGVEVILDEHAAAADIAGQKPQETIVFGTSPSPRLRIVKVASTPVAEPGDEVSFTIRFDNLGPQPIGSVQIIDSLTTRLEYVSGSAQCSLKAHFSTQPNEGESLVVRCVLDDPLPNGKGGVFRFRCIVR
jgi:uncharacterized repeat protein (TIGR01451 family)